MIFELDTETRTAYYSEYAQKAFGLDATVANAPEGFIEQGTVCEGYEETFAKYTAPFTGGRTRLLCGQGKNGGWKYGTQPHYTHCDQG